MSDLISRQAAIEVITKINCISGTGVKTPVIAKCNAVIAIEGLPSADVVKVVRCKNCKWWDIADDEDMKECINNGGYWKADEFCSDAERRTDE